ncbi:hypothetical protein D3C86_1578730 [compost metagenome]
MGFFSCTIFMNALSAVGLIDCASSKTKRIGFPLIPPALLMRSSASRRELWYCVPESAAGPVRGTVAPISMALWANDGMPAIATSEAETSLSSSLRLVMLRSLRESWWGTGWVDRSCN